MKTLIILLLAVPVMAVDCSTGCYKYNGDCACEPVAESGPSVKPSDEKTNHNKITEWEKGIVKADMPPSCAVTNNCSDQKAIDANKAGKKAANIP